MAREQKEQGDGGTGTVAKSLGSFCERPCKHHPGTGARGVEVLGRCQVDDDEFSLCQEALPGSVLYHPCTKTAARFVGPARKEQCPVETSWGRSELMATPHPQLVQPLTVPQGPREQAGTEWQGAEAGGGLGLLYKSQECSSAPVPLLSTGEALRHKLRGVTRVW